MATAQVTLIGNLGGEPTLRFTPSGTAVCNFSLATSRKQGEEFVSSWWDVTAWQNLAETCAEVLQKGSKVVLSGTIHMHEWEDQDGNKRTRPQVTADYIGLDLRGVESYQKKVRANDESRGNAPAESAW